MQKSTLIGALFCFISHNFPPYKEEPNHNSPPATKWIGGVARSAEVVKNRTATEGIKKLRNGYSSCLEIYEGNFRAGVTK